MGHELRFEQDPLEDRAWDQALLGDAYPVFLGALRQTQTLARALGTLEPLSQVLLANAFSMLKLAALQTRPDDVPEVNPILHAALDAYGRAAAPRPIATLGFAWTPLQAVPTSGIDSRFDLFITELLGEVGLARAFKDNRRLHLNALIFHPVQNAVIHGGQREGSSTIRFAGLAVRRIGVIHPLPPSIEAYLTAYHLMHAAPTTEFLEVIVHDDGLGIADHFYRAQNEPGSPALRSLSIAREWIALNRAVEIHSTSRTQPVHHGYPKRTLGVGLYDLLDRVRHLNGYLELRSGRLRAYRWFKPNEGLHDQFQFQPQGDPAPAEYCPGTVFRIVVPADASATAQAADE